MRLSNKITQLKTIGIASIQSVRALAIFFGLLLFLSFNSPLNAQEELQYKVIDSTALFMEVHYPVAVEASEAPPAMVFFFGGGWVGGNRNQFLRQAKYFAERGLVCFLVDYRTKNKNNTTPFEALKDAKSAIRYIRKNATDFGIDPDRLIASGGSAGGHLAAAAATITDYNEITDDLSVSCVPNALVLFNPVIDNGPGGFGYGKIKDAYKNFSPLHNIRRGAPPSLILLGTQDHLIPVATADYYATVMKKVKSRCDLKLFEGQKHGFFNYSNFEYYKKTVFETDLFLQSLGYLEKNPNVDIK
ncbi:alpha/beta hydrolase [Flavobacteriaceae bacterium]|nr:alpha/beta hydrolase [Flavobacteriaceae bacterium]